MAATIAFSRAKAAAAAMHAVTHLGPSRSVRDRIVSRAKALVRMTDVGAFLECWDTFVMMILRESMSIPAFLRIC